MNDSIKSVVVLVAICLVVTVALSAVNHVTAPIIEEANLKKVQASLITALPGSTGFDEIEKQEGWPETVTGVYKDKAGNGYVVTLDTKSQYSNPNMGITVGIGTDGIIKDVVITAYTESKDFKDYPERFKGKDSALSGVDTYAGVTYSSNALKSAINDAYTVLFSVADIKAGEKSSDQLAAEAIAAFVPAAVSAAGECKVTEENGIFVSDNRAGFAMVVEQDGAKVVLVSDAQGNYLGCTPEGANADEAKIAELTAAVTAAGQSFLLEVLPGAASFEELELTAEVPETVTAVYKDTAGNGFVVNSTAVSQYSESPMAISVGIGTDGIIKNIVVTNYAESKDFGADYPATYIGKDSALAGVDTVAGVTYSSNALKSAVNDAFTAVFAVADVAAGEKTDEQLAQEALAALAPASVNNAGVCEVTEDNGLFVTANRTGYAMVAQKNAYVADAFGNYLGCTDASAEDAAVVEALTAAATDAYAAASEKSVERIVKIYKDAEVSVMTVNAPASTVNGAYSFASEGVNYYAFTASPFGYGGKIDILYVVNENGEVAKFKVLTHNETEYYGIAIAESDYAKGYDGAALDTIGDDVTVIAGCTFTTNAAKQALADVTAAFNAVKEAL